MSQLMNRQEILRALPSVDQLLRLPALEEAIGRSGRDQVRDRLREVLADLRRSWLEQGTLPGPPEVIREEVLVRLHHRLGVQTRRRTQRVINATGVVLHTNLGRAPLAPVAIEAIREVASGYCNLEYDLASGKRGKRGTGLEAMLGDLLSAPAAAVVNNCAAAVLLTLNALAEGGEVIISRGELVEIGGSFRIPDVIAKSGARLREVGTTNRTRLSDYEAAITPETKLILRVHPSNYRIVGFTRKPELSELAALARAHQIPLFDDLGSGSLVDLRPIGIPEEPTAAESLAAGVSVVAFSGDKLLGGPQCGIIVGEASHLQRIKSNPLMRALRVDKLTYAALEATVASYLRGTAREEIPALAALHATRGETAERVTRFLDRTAANILPLRLEAVDGSSVVGGGSAPEVQLPSVLVRVAHPTLSAAELETWLRQQTPPIIGRIEGDHLLLDLRTVHPEEEPLLADRLLALSAWSGPETANDTRQTRTADHPATSSVH
ncbi:MAG: L-seryl-tRNA(Sec) selenium transferase [Blastocatellia bacterium]